MNKESLVKRLGKKVLFCFLSGFLVFIVFSNYGCVDEFVDPNSEEPEEPVIMLAPVAMLTANPTEGDAPLEVSFDGSLSYARTSGCYLEKYHWDFDGDGNTDVISEQNWINHTYEEAGEYGASLIVVDNQGQKSDKDLETIVVNEEPEDIFPSGKIAFFGRRHYISPPLEITDWEIYVMNADGTEQTRLTDTVGDNWFHKWSPDGSKIAFTSRRDGDCEIYVMDADGQNQTNLSQNANSDGFPDWSPDGSKIAFSSNRDGIYQIYVMNSDGSNQTNISNAPFNDTTPVWSPDGKFIAFYSYYGGNMELMAMNSDGSEQLVLTNTPENEEDDGAKWAPDGSNGILFTRGSPFNQEIIVRYPDREENLSNHEADDAFPDWSPDGNWIAFASKRSGDCEIYTIRKDGSDLTRLTYSDNEDTMPAWSPDGDWITFVSYRESFPKFEIYVMKRDGSNQKRLTYEQGDEYNPRWRPKIEE